MDELKGQKCMFCGEKKLTLLQDELDIPYFGKVFAFSMKCDGCNFYKSDVEAAEIKDPSKITFTVSDKKDLNVRVVKSAEALVKIPGLRIDSRPGPAAEGYVSNIEGLLNKFKKIIENLRDSTDDNKERKSAKNLLKKLWKVQCGDLELKIVIEDPTGNSGIISDKAVVEKLKVKK
jgi:zinc finger protein